MKTELKKQKFRIGISDLGVFCFYEQKPFDAYLWKDGTIANSYNGDFFKTFEEAGKFLDEYLKKEFPQTISRQRVAEVFGLDLNFELVD